MFILPWTRVYHTIAIAIAAFILSIFLTFSHHITLLPPEGCLSQVAHRHFTVSSSLRGCACDICHHPCEWHLCIVLTSSLLLQISAAYNHYSSLVGRAGVCARACMHACVCVCVCVCGGGVIVYY
jgi:hypothetical protein